MIRHRSRAAIRAIFISCLTQQSDMTIQHPPIEPILKKMNDGDVVKIVCVGDSITYGTLDAGGRATTPWPARLQALLRQYYNNTNITVVNQGVAGSTLAGGITRFDADVTAEAPHLVLFNFGTNDANTNVALATYKERLQTYLNKLLPYPVVVWGLTPRFKEHDSGAGEDTIHFYRRMMQAEATARGLPYVDTFQRLHRLYKSRAVAAGTWSKDGSHYTQDGYTFIGDTIFAEAFANDDTFVAPGQFKGARGQWVVSDGDSTWGGGSEQQDADAVVVSNDTVRAYLYLEDPEPCDLVLHVIADCANATNQSVSINNQSIAGGSATLDTSPDLAGGASYYCNDVAFVVCPLQPGLNNIQLSTSTSVRITGFSVVRRQHSLYLPSGPDAEDRSSDFWGSSRWYASEDAFVPLRNGIVAVSPNSTGHVQPLCMLQPDALSKQSSRFRCRATLFPGAAFYLGQQTNAAGAYGYLWKVAFDGTNCVVTVRDRAGTQRTRTTTALAISATGTDVRIDIRTGTTGTTIWANGTQVFTDNLPLPVGPWQVSSANVSKRSYWNPPIKKGVQASDTGVLRGEKWISFVDNSLHLIKDDGTEATLGGSSGGGLPTGGSAGQALLKSSGTDYDAAWSSLTKSSVGLGNVDNTSDLNKPVSGPQAAAFATKARPIVMKTGSHTLVLGDAEHHIRMNAAGANVLTIPPNSSVAFPEGTDVWVEQTGAGATTVAAGAGVTLRSTVGDHPSARYGVIHYRKIATDTWQVISRT